MSAKLIFDTARAVTAAVLSSCTMNQKNVRLDKKPAMDVAHRLAESLKGLDVEMVFGMPGAATLPLVEAFRRCDIDFVLCRHEASAGFMADAIYQLTGGIGVCVSTLGPGATNLLSGITQSWLERSRVLGLVGQVSLPLLPMYTHQVIDQEALFRPVCKKYYRLHSNRPADQIRLGIRNLTRGAPGPVMMEISEGVATAPCEPIPLEPSPITASSQVTSALDILNKSKRPVLLVGSEDLSVRAAQAISSLSHQRCIPVFTTYRGKGLVDETDALSMGAIGLSPVVDTIAQEFIQHADCIVAVGLDPVELRPNWLPGWSESIAFISLSFRGQPDILCTLDVDLQGDIAYMCEALADGAKFRWKQPMLQEHRQRVEQCFADEPNGPAAMLRALKHLLPDDSILCLDVGAHRITACHVWTCREPRRILQSNGFSSMGVGLPMAIAAKLKFPEKQVVAFCGDMGLWMALGELGVVQERRMDLLVIYVADRSLSLIELKQERAQYARHGVSFENPDVEALGHAFGGQGHRVRDSDQLATAVNCAQRQGGLHLVELSIDASAYRQQM
jgi:acetolactate synthase I/II/III large subunit